MWKTVNGKLIQTTDNTRVKFRTNISRSIIESLKIIAAQNNTSVNYLLETGLANVLQSGTIQFSKEARPKDRMQYKTTYDKELLEEVKQFATTQKLYINDVIEYSVAFINIENSKKMSHRYRVEC